MPASCRRLGKEREATALKNLTLEKESAPAGVSPLLKEGM
jgi:hypothetical protein